MSENLGKEITVGFSLRKKKAKILAVKERDNGDLVIALNRAQYYREANNIASPNSPEILQQKYSVHQSLKSTNDINTLTHTIELSNGEKIETSHYTQAIKRFKKFAPIFGALSPSLNSERFALNAGKGETLILGSHNPKSSLIFYMVCVAEKGTQDNFSELGEIYLFSSRKLSFTHFDIHVLWTFTPRIFLDADGAKMHFTTHRNRKEVAEQERYRFLVEGFAPNEICDLFVKTRNELHDEYINLTLIKLDSQKKRFSEMAYLFSHPKTFSSMPKQLIQLEI